MAMNTIPVFTKSPKIEFGTVIAANANTALDGTGTVTTVFTANATEGSFVMNLKVKAGNTTATSAAGVLRVWINNGSSNAVSTNNTLIAEYVLSANTASATANTLNYDFPLNFMMPAGYKINVTVSTMAASSIWAFTCFGADYS